MSENGLHPAQQRAVALIAEGKTTRETAEVLGVSERSVVGWRNRHPEFIAALNHARRDRWDAEQERLRSLVGRSIDVLAAGLESPLEKTRLLAAQQVLRSVGLFKTNLAPKGATDEEEAAIDVLTEQRRHSTKVRSARALGAVVSTASPVLVETASAT
jgi:hypothetical protein